MRYRPVAFAVLLMAVLVAAATADPGRADKPRLDRRRFMDVDEIKPGMVGIGKTVFRGSQVDEFHIEILGIARRAYNGADVILAKILDGPVVERETGIIAGMSGSPVYINGRLIGAIALGWWFPKEPIAGITPIAEMLRALDPAAEPPAAQAPAAFDLETPINVNGETWRSLRIHPGLPANVRGEPGVGALMPMGGLAVASGFSERALDQLRAVLEPRGTLVVAGLGGGGNHEAPATLEAGGVVGVLAVGGDLDFAWMGTVTYVDRERVLAFGHSMLSLGAVDLPMSSGIVHDVMPSYQASFKLSDSGPVLGRVYQDQVWAVGGALGETAPTIPMTVSVRDLATGEACVLEVTIGRVEPLMSVLAGGVIITAIDRAMRRHAEGTARIRLRIDPEGYDPIPLAETVFDLHDVAMPVAASAVKPLHLLWENEFGGAKIERISAEIEIESTRRIALLERVYARESKIKAGDSIQLGMVFRPYAQEPVTRHIAIPIPEDCPTGPVRVVVSGGSSVEQARAGLGLAPFKPNNLGDLIDYYRRQHRADEMVVQAALPIMGINVENRKLPWLPTGAIDVLRAAKSSEIRPEPEEQVIIEPADWIIVGMRSLVVSVEGKRPPAVPPQPPKPPKPPAGTPRPPSAPPGDDGDGQGLAAPPPRPAARVELAGPRPARADGSPNGNGNAAPEPANAAEDDATKPIGRVASEWKHSTASDFDSGERDQVALGSEGSLQLSHSVETVLELEQPIAWSVAASEDQVWVGAGNSGEIYRRGPDGEPGIWFDSPEVAVHSLLLADDGSLFAGTSPRGRIYRIAPDGKSELYFETGQEYVWALLRDEQGHLYAATGMPGKVWRIDAQARGEVILESPAAHVLALARAADGTLYAGTGSGAVVYRVPTDGPAVPLYNAPGHAVQALAVDSQGHLYVGSSPDGDIYRLDRNGNPEKFHDTPDRHVFAIAIDNDGDLYAATGGPTNGRVCRIDEHGAAETILLPKQGQFLGLAVGPDGRLYAVGSNPGLVQRLSAGYAASGAFESKPLDAKRPARWGRIAWMTEAPEGTSVTVQTRTGNTSDPDDRWSPWSVPYGQSEGQQIASPPARFLQYRVNLATSDPARTAVLRQIEIGYLPSNQAPQVEIVEPKPDNRWSKKQTIKCKGTDEDKDTLVYDLYASSDTGKTWSEIAKGIAKPEYKWDTTKQSDGRIMLKVVASDRRSNPADPLSDEAIVSLWVDNTDPVCLLLRNSIKVGDDGVLTASGVATDTTTTISGVDFRIDQGDWRAASSPTGIFDAASVDFRISAGELPPGDHELSARAFDSAGNVATDEAKFDVKPSPERAPTSEDGDQLQPTTPSQ